jgi:hypothetical protein
MKKIKALSVFLTLIFILSCAVSASWDLDGQKFNNTTEIYPGVMRHYIETPASSPYKLQKINIIEFDLAQRDLYLDVV